jgi:transposase
LSFFTGFLISDGYSAYQQLLPQLAGVQQCCQHIIRRCRAVTRLGPGSLQSWAADITDALRDAHLDHRHFRVIRPLTPHSAFRLLPADVP